jgi:hypothetical protein
MCQIMFEKYKVPAVFISKNAVLSSFSCGRSTAIVLDSGGGTTCVAPVHDGSACLAPAPGRSVNTSNEVLTLGSSPQSAPKLSADSPLAREIRRV